MREQVFIIEPETRERTIQRLSRFLTACLPGKRLRVRVDRMVKRRSVDQNAALFGLAYTLIREETGNDLEDLHDFYCKQFFGAVDKIVFGQVKSKPIRTTTTDADGNRDVISTIEMCDFWLMVQTHAATELGLEIPDPDPNWKNAA